MNNLDFDFNSNSNLNSYYDILEVNKNATPDEIKKSYRRLSMIHHPDKNNNTPESIKKIQEINQAYEILSDEKQRCQYDFENTMTQNEINLNDIFSGLFHMGNVGGNPFGAFGPANVRVFYGDPRQMFKQIPQSIIKNINIPFEKVLHDIKIPIEICRTIQDNNTQFEEIETIYIDIPRGIDDNEIILIKEKGNILNGIKGDIKLIVKIDNSTKFNRVGLDLIYEHTITLKESLCGFSFKIEHLNGTMYTITNTTNVGHVIGPNYKKLIPNLGLSRGNIVGNLVILFNIKFPEILTSEIVEQLKVIDF
jgi:DnaJ-class molecular chaperone